ncbi:hypothetical protein CFE70_000622 [Pyrenophora teres f. teres 0-1]|nr:hypothetical protein HRS9139_04207 [Pyrenophora teres f. teres]KAE8837918.1 hypothetical protein PTNB85_05253 [Pyrenophora teres f. teres]KAE8839661.1 hypothetical protein HRS9122_06266 [Pyrenophora teres f. teres]KAE8862741.1 hypothetical protein PTNB29_05303 [Pyrenophora teres f. teres]KAE8869021.1 hypothetical protein PTNB73_04074 [Pyrenophora teres f. teres]
MFASRTLTLAASRPLTTRFISLRPSTRLQTALFTTITSAITHDHRALESSYREILSHPTDIDHQTRHGNQFTWELARHSVAEELLVYPAMEKYLGAAGKQHADADRAQHHEVKELLKDFQNTDAGSSTYIPKLEKLWSVLKKHIEEEEREDLPMLEEALGKREGESEGLAKRFERTKMFVPSRAHPSAGENPYFEGPMGLLAAPIDHIADIFRKFPDNTVSPNPSTK